MQQQNSAGVNGGGGIVSGAQTPERGPQSTPVKIKIHGYSPPLLVLYLSFPYPDPISKGFALINSMYFALKQHLFTAFIIIQFAKFVNRLLTPRNVVLISSLTNIV